MLGFLHHMGLFFGTNIPFDSIKLYFGLWDKIHLKKLQNNDVITTLFRIFITYKKRLIRDDQYSFFEDKPSLKYEYNCNTAVTHTVRRWTSTVTPESREPVAAVTQLLRHHAKMVVVVGSCALTSGHDRKIHPSSLYRSEGCQKCESVWGYITTIASFVHHLSAPSPLQQRRAPRASRENRAT